VEIGSIDFQACFGRQRTQAARLVAEVVGEVEAEEGVLVIRRIHVDMQLVAPAETRETVHRVHGIYAMNCPLYRTLHKAIQLTSSYALILPKTP
jgi:uncharacterized OsmC-like protein